MSPGWTESLRRRADRLLRPGGRAVILLYHRIADDPTDPYGLCVAPARFEEHLAVVRDVGRPMSVRDLARAIRSSSVPDGAICITFDDGYADNLYAAKPLLAKHDVPATVFMTTGDAGREREFWWDALERAFLEPERLPDRIRIEIAGRRFDWELGADAMTADDLRRKRQWHILDDDAPGARHAAFREAYEAIRPLARSERTRVIDALLREVGLTVSAVRSSRRALDAAGVVELSREGLVEIGAHTVHHPALPAQEPDVQRDEIVQSKSDVEAWLGTTIEGFAYPYGLYDRTSVAAVRGAGFAWACSCDGGPARRGTDVHLLPRAEVGDWTGDRLEDVLRRELGRSPRTNLRH